MDGKEGNCSCGAKLRFVRRDKSGPAKFDVYECTSSKCGRMAVERTNLVEEFSIEDLGDIWGPIFIPYNLFELARRCGALPPDARTPEEWAKYVSRQLGALGD